MADLTVIIVTWNSGKFLRQCLQSLADARPRSTLEIIIVDNGSTDGCVEEARGIMRDVRVLSNEENKGFATANNQALRLAQSRYVLLLNPDTVVPAGALDTLVGFMDQHPQAWAVGPLLLNADGSPQRTGVRFPTNWNVLCEALFLDRLFPRTRLFGSHRELFEDQTARREVDYVQGSCLMVRRDALQKAGEMDEQFFLYFEETDWCFRMKAAGGQVFICPAARVTHFGGGELGHYDEFRLLAYHASMLRFYRKHYAAWRRIGLRIILLARSSMRAALWAIVALVRPAVRGAARSSARGYLRSMKLIVADGASG